MSSKKLIRDSDEELLHLPYFDWDKVKYFYYAAKLGSFSAAAKFFNTAQPAISRKISILEDHLKCNLFVRLPRGLKLTSKGERLFQIVERTFWDLKEFSFENASSGIRERKIRICSTNALISYVLSDLLIAYNQENPHLKLELIGEDHSIDFAFKNIDIAIRPLDIRIKGEEKKQNGLVYDELLSIQKILFAAEGYIDTYGEPQTVEDLKNHRLLAFGPDPEEHPYADLNWILGLGMPNGEFHEPVFTSNSIEALVKAAQNGIGIIGSYSEFSIIRNSGLKNILPHVKHHLVKDYFIYPEYLKKDLEIIKIRDYLKSELDKQD